MDNKKFFVYIMYEYTKKIVTAKSIIALGIVFWLTQLHQSKAQDVINTGTLYVTSGTTVFMGGNFTNNTSATTENNGIIQLNGNWTNDGTYIPDTGEVKLSGASQLITGSVSTTFYDMVLQGTGIKTMTLDATVAGTLSLNDRELATDTNTMFVTNTDTGAITRTTGFVSSLDTGSLSRNTDTALTYLFPVGSSLGTPRYRPVEITPNSVSAHIFTVRMANVDATIEGFDRTVKDSTLSLINPNFYHRINRMAGINPADIAIYFDDVLDSTYQAMAHWQNLPQWENTGTVTVINNVSPVLSYIAKTAWNDFSYTPFALSTEPPPVVLSSSDTVICQGDSVTFTATAGFADYRFFVNGITAQTGTDSIYTTDSLSNGDTVFVAATDGFDGVSYSDTIVMIVNPTYNTPVSTSICQGDSIQLSGGSWVTSSGIYNDTLTTVAGCDSVITTTVTVDSVYLIPASASICQGDSVQLPGGSWVTSSGIYNDTLITIAGCDSIIATTVIVDSVYFTSTSSSICQGDSIQLPGGSWVLSAGIYNDTLSSLVGCDSIIITTVAVDSVYSIPASASICQGDSAQLPGGAWVSIAGTYYDTLTSVAGCDSIIATTLTVNTTWSIPVFASICSNDSIFLEGAYQNTAGMYYDTLPTVNNCDSVITTTLTVLPLPTAGITGTTTICFGESTILTATGGSSYLWNTGDTTVSISVNPLTSTSYSVVVSNSGCVSSDSATVTITVNPLPIINAIPESTTIIQGESVTLNVSGGISYSWIPATGLDNPFSSNPTAAPTETILYYVSGTDANGCENIDSVLINVSEEFAIGVPNVFSPNGDGENDILYVESKGVKWLRFIIYDRWGEKVFESNDVNTGWDGRYRSKPMNPAVFVYYLEAEFTNGKEITEQGNITLVR